MPTFVYGDFEWDEEKAAANESPQERILYVVTTEPGSRTRIISARRASTHERRIYEADP